MNEFESKIRFDRFLENLGEALDITETQAQQAKTSYKSVGEWLSRPNSSIASYRPKIYPQGSFRLGTVVRPIADEDNFDVDIVCLLSNLPPGMSQCDLKNLVGDELKQNEDYRRMLRDEEGRRCWTLQYADSRKFHIDVLPSTDDDFEWLLRAGVPHQYAQHAIKVTDKTCDTYQDGTDTHWTKSNPVGYASWFKDRMEEVLEFQKRQLSSLRRKSVEEIKDYEVRTPLQRAVQILKRHRDVMFGDDFDRPISVIITTLAAKAYQNESNIFDTLIRLLQDMPGHIVGVAGSRVVLNPVNPLENFADKWESSPDREKNFYAWLAKATDDLVQSYNSLGFDKSTAVIREALGEKTVNAALRKQGLDWLVGERSRDRQANQSVLSVGHRQSPSWMMNLSGTVSLAGRFKPQKTWKTITSNSILPKGVSLRFTASTSVPKPYQVYWQVVNTGREAANDLRGSIFPAEAAGAGGLRRDECTRYEGLHWIECFIVKDGVCVARSGEFIVRIGAN